MMWGYGPGFGVFGIFYTVVFWVAIAVLIIIVFRYFASSGGEGKGPPPPRRPIDILQERYARGEIDEPTFLRMSELLLRSKKEYEEKKRDLSE